MLTIPPLLKFLKTVLILKYYRKGKRKNDEASTFYTKYQNHWKQDENIDNEDDNDDNGLESESSNTSGIRGSITRIRKRRLQALENINNTFMDHIEADAKKLKYDETSQFVSTLPTSSWAVKDVFNYDDKVVCKQVKKRQRKSLKKEFALVEPNRSEAFTSYINNVSNTAPSLHTLQEAIRTPPVSPSEYDFHVHEDYRVAEKLLGHFIDLIQAPRKVLQSKCLERTAACLTTVYIINTLFTPKNEIVDFRWIEITHTSTDNLKWDGLGLPVSNHSAASVVSEFAGGINVGTLGKKISDEVKMTSHARKVVDQNNAFTKKHEHAKVYCLLYHDMILSMDILIEEENKYVKKNLMKIKLPRTEVELKKFASQLDLLLQWRDTVLKHAKGLEEDD
ncbi:hypothetical protein INT45_006054 [Circinella minor]|uniref:Uncharacterized protein n=1 Tax=Circinella minor TaxID=1195481 RepID=A0A8H7RYP5_9FUNG|nr:hypothetical protein INT45_006054 [Circinella minor]